MTTTTRTLAHYEYPIDRIRELETLAGAMLAALKEIDIVCNESAGDCRKRMGTRVGNSMTIARAAIAQAEAAGIK